MYFQYTAAATVLDPTNLWQVIQDYVGNAETGFIRNIPNFIQEAETRIYNSVQLPLFRKNQTGALTVGVQYLTLPTDYISAFSFAVLDPVTSSQSYLVNKDVDFIRGCYPIASVLNTPRYYAPFDEYTLIVGPTPDQSYNVELHYQYFPPSITVAGTSWLGNNFGALLLYGALREAYIFMKGEADIITMYETKYTEELALFKMLGDGKNRRDSYRSGQTRTTVK